MSRINTTPEVSEVKKSKKCINYERIFSKDGVLIAEREKEEGASYSAFEAEMPLTIENYTITKTETTTKDFSGYSVVEK